MAQDERAVPITRVIAERVSQLRRSKGLTHSELAERVRQQGPTWNRSTVVKLENKRRESVTVQELLALAVVLDVPPVWLLADPKSATPVPITDGVEPDPWSALMWMVGTKPLVDGFEWNDVEIPLEHVAEVYSLVTLIRRAGRHRDMAGKLLGERYDGQSEDETERRALDKLAMLLEKLLTWGFQVPPLPDEVVKRAHELGVALPGQGGGS